MKNKEITINDLKDFLKDFWTPLLILGVIIVLTLTLFKPTLVKWGELKIENQKLQKKLQLLTQKANRLQKLSETDLESQVDKMESVFPSQEKTLTILSLLTKESEQRKVVLGDVNLEENYSQKNASSSGKIVISFNLKGKNADVASFLSDLQYFSPLLNIERISAFGDKRGDMAGLAARLKEGHTFLNLTVSSVWKNTPEEIAAVTSPLPVLNKKQKDVLEEVVNFKKNVFSEKSAFNISNETTQIGKEDPFILLED